MTAQPAATDEVVLYDLVLTYDPDTGSMDLTGQADVDRNHVFEHLRAAAAAVLGKLPDDAKLRFLEQGMAHTTPFPIRHTGTIDAGSLVLRIEAVDDDAPFNMKAAIYRTLAACRGYRLDAFEDNSTISEPA